MSTSHTLCSSLHWQPLAHLSLSHPRQQRPSPSLRNWLQDKGSLTARLIAASDGQFQVKVLRQVIALPSRSEQQALEMKRPSLALIREVALYGCNQPWVFARSLLPLTSLTGSLRHLRKQGNRPLGAFLFSQPHLVRSPIAVAAISPEDAYVPAALTNNTLLWGRRSVFYLASKPLLVSEVFLPAFCARLA